ITAAALRALTEADSDEYVSSTVTGESYDELAQRETEYETQLKLNHEKRLQQLFEREAEKLQKKTNQYELPKPDKFYSDKEEKLLRCYLRNQDRVLDCWKEVEDLKTAAKLAQLKV
ncbi:hypothetical protein HDU92_007781, partial [Lobulomyces angularis]